MTTKPNKERTPKQGETIIRNREGQIIAQVSPFKKAVKACLDLDYPYADIFEFHGKHAGGWQLVANYESGAI